MVKIMRHMRLNLKMLKEALVAVELPEPTDEYQKAFILVGDYRDKFVEFSGSNNHVCLNLISIKYPPIRRGNDNFQWELEL